MNRALMVLGEWIQLDGSLRGYGQFVCFPELEGGRKVALEGVFSVEQVEALAWWMRRCQSCERLR